MKRDTDELPQIGEDENMNRRCIRKFYFQSFFLGGGGGGRREYVLEDYHNFSNISLFSSTLNMLPRKKFELKN